MSETPPGKPATPAVLTTPRGKPAAQAPVGPPNGRSGSEGSDGAPAAFSTPRGKPAAQAPVGPPNGRSGSEGSDGAPAAFSTPRGKPAEEAPVGPPNGRSGSEGSDGAPAVRSRTAGVKEDFGRASRDYARHRAGFPARFYTELSHRRLLEPGRRVVDLGTGTGTIARELARRGLEVTALDVSPQQIEAARRTSDLPVDWRVGPAEETGLPDASFDLVTAGQCWHWFKRDAAVAECRRLLRPGGALVIAHFDWLPMPGSLARATEDLILQFNPGWSMSGGDGLHPGWFTDLASFADLESFTFDHDQPYTHVDWRGRIRASAGVGASLPADEVAAFDEELAALLAERFPEEPVHVRHRVFALIGHHEGGAQPEARRAKARGCG